MSWSEVYLRDVCARVDYGLTASATVNPIGPKFLRITDIVPDVLDWAYVPFCNVDASMADKFRLRDGDIVVARTGATVGYAKQIKNPPESVFASYLVRFRCRDDVDSAFVGHIVTSQAYKQYVALVAGGAAQPNANAQVLGGYRFRLPSIEVQRKISSVLSAYEKLIENNTQRISLLEQMAHRTYDEWFVHYRFPGCAAAHFYETSQGSIPQGWKVSDVAEAYEGLFDGPHATPAPSDEGPIFLGIKNVREQGGLDLSEIRHIAEAEYPKWTQRVVPRTGDIVFTYEATLNRYALIPPGVKCCLGRRMALIRPKPEYRHFLYIHFFSEAWRKIIAERTLSGATVDRIPLSKFPNFPIVLPTNDIAAAFEREISPIMSLARVLDRQCTNLRTQRDLLLPRLVSGEVDLAAIEALPIAAE